MPHSIWVFPGVNMNCSCPDQIVFVRRDIKDLEATSRSFEATLSEGTEEVGYFSATLDDVYQPYCEISVEAGNGSDGANSSPSESSVRAINLP
jgi:hypothetical protein